MELNAIQYDMSAWNQNHLTSNATTNASRAAKTCQYSELKSYGSASFGPFLYTKQQTYS